MRILFTVALLVLASMAAAQERALNKEVVVAAPIADVWKAWTTREGITSF